MASGSSAHSGDFALQRRALLDALRKNRLITERSLRAMDRVPREAFVDPELRDRAYEDSALPIGEGQTISQPTVVGIMTSALEVRPNSHILEIGTGSGYQAAVLARLGKSVVSIELVESLVERARKVLDSLGIDNVEVHHSDGSLGWPDAAPYDRIIVTAAAPSVPEVLL
ncbi:MAG: protein-L-isoaspartate(D-aspartate) O-methyltransferase, partial [Chloroflexota bacterium]